MKDKPRRAPNKTKESTWFYMLKLHYRYKYMLEQIKLTTGLSYAGFIRKAIEEKYKALLAKNNG